MVSVLFYCAGLVLLVLLVPAALSIYKPWGLTPYGRRKQHEQRARSGDRVEEAGRRVGRQRRSDGDCLAVGVGVACPRPFEEHGPVDDVPQRARHCAVVADSSFACKRPRPASNPERPPPLDSLLQSW